MKGSHLFWLSRAKGMTVDIWIRDYNPPRCFQLKISDRSKHNAGRVDSLEVLQKNHPKITAQTKEWQMKWSRDHVLTCSYMKP
jgi:hypothetical protein